MSESLPTMYLKYAFTEDELKEISGATARDIDALSSMRDDKKAAMSDFNGRIDRLEAKTKAAAAKTLTGYEYREIEVEVIKDYGGKQVRTHRIDTGELVDERPMTDDELQMELPTGGKGNE